MGTGRYAVEPGNGLSANRHKTLVVAHDGNGSVVEFENGDRPSIAFTDDYVRIGCRKITRAAWELINERFEKHLQANCEEVMQKGNY